PGERMRELASPGAANGKLRLGHRRILCRSQEKVVRSLPAIKLSEIFHNIRGHCAHDCERALSPLRPGSPFFADRNPGSVEIRCSGEIFRCSADSLSCGQSPEFA